MFYHSFVDLLIQKYFEGSNTVKKDQYMPCCFISKGDYIAYSDSFTSFIADNMSVLAGCDRGEICLFSYVLWYKLTVTMIY